MTIRSERDDLQSRIDRLEQRVDKLEKKQEPPTINPASFTGTLVFTSITSKDSCPVCGHAAITHEADYPYTSERHFKGVQTLWCGQCGSGHVPNGREIVKTYYQSEYAEANRGDRSDSPSEYFRELISERSKLGFYAHRAFTHALLLRQQGSGLANVLDYGSGPGYFLYLSNAEKKFAIEPDSYSKKYLDFIGAKTLELKDLPDAYFDAIVASHSVEHLTNTDLSDTIDKLYSSLKIGGLMLVEVPHGGLSYLRMPWKHEPHTLFFTPQGIEAALKRENVEFVVKTCRGQVAAEKLPFPIFAPDHRYEFRRSTKGAITLIARKTS